ncbi:MAG: ABC transporter permease subunit [Blautia sp.]|uniref:ABC transporter permease n=1 Tax=Blautia sp. TaxID=1955243 RepID=UPI002A748B62|nr:ABC transporter permease subunit [Blautia sp.]MDY3015578.1 ABC transporter permease subunit [Blautia sp.]MED9881633.1 ABC transporter permease subunit [Blautia sp.]
MSNTSNEQTKTNNSFEENFIDENVAAKSSRVKDFIKKFMKRKTAVVGFIIMILLVFLALFGEYLAPYDPDAYDYVNMLQGPSAEHWFGTDHYGRDILSRLLAGTRLTLGVSLSSVIVGAALGTVLGLLAGYYGGVIEMLVMRGSDVLFSFPDILLAIAIVAILGPGIVNVFIAVMVFTVPSFARIMRSATLAVKGSLYVEVAQSLGCKDGRLLFVHIFPGTIQSLIVNFTMRIGSAIMAASSLSFLGFGANVTDPEWGAMLSQGRTYLNTAPHMVYLPGLVIFITVLAFNLFGDGLRDTLDPKIK